MEEVNVVDDRADTSASRGLVFDPEANVLRAVHLCWFCQERPVSERNLADPNWFITCPCCNEEGSAGNSVTEAVTAWNRQQERGANGGTPLVAAIQEATGGIRQWCRRALAHAKLW